MKEVITTWLSETARKTIPVNKPSRAASPQYFTDTGNPGFQGLKKDLEMSKNRLNIFLKIQKTKLQGHKNDSGSNIKWQSQLFTTSVHDSLTWTTDRLTMSTMLFLVSAGATSYVSSYLEPCLQWKEWMNFTILKHKQTQQSSPTFRIISDCLSQVRVALWESTSSLLHQITT